MTNRVIALDRMNKNENRKKYLENKPEKRLIWSAKKRSKEQKLPFNLTEEDIKIPTHCPYLGIELTTHAPRGTSRATVCSLDKIDPKLGYVVGNVEVISHQANSMKQWASREELLRFSKYVLERFG